MFFSSLVFSSILKFMSNLSSCSLCNLHSSSQKYLPVLPVVLFCFGLVCQSSSTFHRSSPNFSRPSSVSLVPSQYPTHSHSHHNGPRPKMLILSDLIPASFYPRNHSHEMEVTEIILATISRLCQLSSHSHGFLSRL